MSPRVDNETGALLEAFELLHKDGEKLVVLLKATLALVDGRLEVAPEEEQRAIRFADVPWGDPVTSPPKYPADAGGYRPGTDVVVVAEGHAPEGRAVPSFDVGVRVGPLEKSLRVVGPRVWLEDGLGLSAPRPTTDEPIRYDLAYGGLDATGEAVVEEPRNPVGLGVTSDPARLVHQRGPSIELPSHPIVTAASGEPAGYGAIGPHWQPRRGLVGTFDAQWQENQMPLLPRDHDDRANQCASPGLTAVPHLRGDEEVSLMNLTPGGGVVLFRLPGRRPVIELEHKTHLQRREPPLDQVVIDLLGERPVIELVWRTLEPVPRRLSDLGIHATWSRP